MCFINLIFKNGCIDSIAVAELDILDFDASILSSEYRLPIATMIKELRKHEA